MANKNILLTFNPLRCFYIFQPLFWKLEAGNIKHFPSAPELLSSSIVFSYTYVWEAWNWQRKNVEDLMQ